MSLAAVTRLAGSSAAATAASKGARRRHRKPHPDAPLEEPTRTTLRWEAVSIYSPLRFVFRPCDSPPGQRLALRTCPLLSRRYKLGGRSVAGRRTCTEWSACEMRRTAA